MLYYSVAFPPGRLTPSQKSVTHDMSAATESGTTTSSYFRGNLTQTHADSYAKQLRLGSFGRAPLCRFLRLMSMNICFFLLLFALAMTPSFYSNRQQGKKTRHDMTHTRQEQNQRKTQSSRRRGR